MKKTIYFFSLIIAMATSFISCSKDSDEAITKVEYRISPINNYFVEVSYTGADGQTITTTNLSTDMPGGSKTVNVDAKPFAAKMAIYATNTGTQPYNYTLSIYVNGQLKASKALVLAAIPGGQLSSVNFLVE